MMRENWNETTHPDCKLDCGSDDLPEFAINDLPFLPPDFSPQNTIERVYAEYCVFAVRCAYQLVEPQAMLIKHHNKACLLTLTAEQVRLLEGFIQKLDELELEKIGKSLASRNGRRVF